MIMKDNIEMQNKNKSVFTKDMLIKSVSEDCNKTINTVRLVYNSLEDKIIELLASVDPNTDVSVRMFEGISLSSFYVPEKIKVNNLTGETILSKSKVKAKANITRNYCDKLTNYNK